MITELARLALRITIAICEEIVAAIDGRPDEFDGYHLEATE